MIGVRRRQALRALAGGLAVAQILAVIQAIAILAGAAPAGAAVGDLPLPDYNQAAVANPTATASAGTVPMGGTRGRFSVSDSGAAQYEVPLAVLPGRGGLQPSLSLRYSSDAANGVAGVGFTLSGLSQISRCDKTVADNGTAEGVRLEDSDRFCLNGQQLFAVSGGYGADGTEYRTRPDSHVRVRSFRPGNTPGGPAGFTVWTADGQVQDYGTRPEGGQLSQAVQVLRGSGYVNLGWPIVRTRDRSGNAITYNYSRFVAGGSDNSEVERVLSSILYGSTATALDRIIRFDYQIRPDKRTGFRYGVRHELTRRLSAITELLATPAGEQRSRGYTFGYDNGGPTKASKLSSITECGSVPAECRRPTVLTWLPGDQGFFNPIAQTSADGRLLVPSTVDSQLITGDFNGDGRTDLVWPEGQASPGTEPRIWKYLHAEGGSYRTVRDGAFNGYNRAATAYPIDYDLDGMVDLLPREAQINTWGPILSRSGFHYVPATTNFVGGFNQVTAGNQTAGALLGDVNGDGYQDVLEYRDPLGGEDGDFMWALRTRTGQLSATIDDDPPHDEAAFTAQQPLAFLAGIAPSAVFVLDINGDGRDELIYNDHGTVRGHDFVHPNDPVQHGLDAGIFNGVTAKVLDVNGDGLSDLITTSGVSGSGTTELKVRMNTGNGFAPQSTTGLSVYKDALKGAEVIDFDGDGRHDLLVPRRDAGSGLYVGLDLVRIGTDGAGKPTYTLSASSISLLPQPLDVLLRQGMRVVDANGDGLDDVLTVNREGGQNNLVLYTHRGGTALPSGQEVGPKPDLLFQVYEGDAIPQGTVGDLPATLTVRFAPITDPNVYSRGACPRNPFVSCLVGSMYVVKQVWRDSGVVGSDDESVSNYFYRGGRIDKKARTFLGFGERKVTTTAAPGARPSFDRTFYSNTVPGRDPRPVERWQAQLLADDHATLTRTNLGWAEQATVPNGNFFSYLTRTETRGYDLTIPCAGCLGSWTPSTLDGTNPQPVRSTVDTVTGMDGFGNPGSQVTESTGNGASRTDVVSSYAIDAGEWLVRRPARVVTKDQVQDGTTGQWYAATRTVDYTYLAANTLVAQEKRYASQASPGRVLVTDYGYDATGAVERVSRTDPASGEVREETTRYDPYGYPHATLNAAGHLTRTGYDPVSGELKVSVDANGLRTDYTVDSLGRPVRTTLPSGAQTTLAYSLELRGAEYLVRMESTDGTGARHQVVTDRAGRTVVERFAGMDGALRERTLGYRAEGWLGELSTYHPVGASTVERSSYDYDAAGRLLTSTDPQNATQSYAYTGLDVTHTDARGNRSRSTLDHRGQAVSIVDGLDSAAQTRRVYQPGPFGELLSTQVEGIDASRSTFGYDDLGAVLTSTDPARGNTLNAYNGFGELLTSRDATGRETRIDYDPIGRQVGRTVTKGGISLSSATYDYDSEGHQGLLVASSLIDTAAGGTQSGIAYGYDQFNRPRSQTYRLGTETLAVQTDRDTFGRVTAMRYPALPGQGAGVKVGYEYTGTNGRLQRVKVLEPAAEAATLWTAQATDGQDRLVREETGDGVGTTRSYKWNGAAISIAHRTSTADSTPNVLLMAEDYGYDDQGNLGRRTHVEQGIEQRSEVFDYDALNRVISAKVQYPNPCPPGGCTELTATSTVDPPPPPPQPLPTVDTDSWSYDKLGNIASSTRRGTYAYDPQRPALVTSVTGGIFGSRAFGYDAVGNQTARPDGSVLYNTFDLPARIARSSGEVVAQFGYYPDGTRARRQVAGGTTTYLPQVYERHQNGDRTEHRLLVRAEGRVVATLVKLSDGGAVTAGRTLYQHQDRLGSTNLVTANVGSPKLHAAVQESRGYDAYGAPRSPDLLDGNDGYTTKLQPSTVDQGYTGHDDDRDLGLVDMGGRVYDPELGRFLTPDPHVDGANASQAWNRYTYVSNNPLRGTDPGGFLECFGCPEDLQGAGGDWSPALDLMLGWAQDDEAFWNEGQAGVDGFDDREIQRGERRYDHDRDVTIHEIEKKEAIQHAMEAQQAAEREYERRTAQRYKEGQPALGGVAEPDSSEGPMTEGADCQPGACGTDTATDTDCTSTDCYEQGPGGHQAKEPGDQPKPTGPVMAGNGLTYPDEESANADLKGNQLYDTGEAVRKSPLSGIYATIGFFLGWTDDQISAAVKAGKDLWDLAKRVGGPAPQSPGNYSSTGGAPLPAPKEPQQTTGH